MKETQSAVNFLNTLYERIQIHYGNKLLTDNELIYSIKEWCDDFIKDHPDDMKLF